MESIARLPFFISVYVHCRAKNIDMYNCALNFFSHSLFLCSLRFLLFNSNDAWQSDKRYRWNLPLGFRCIDKKTPNRYLKLCNIDVKHEVRSKKKSMKENERWQTAWRRWHCARWILICHMQYVSTHWTNRTRIRIVCVKKKNVIRKRSIISSNWSSSQYSRLRSSSSIEDNRYELR